MGSSRKNVEFDPNGGPGTYNLAKEFGFDAKSFIIGEHRTPSTHLSVGPADYDPTRANSLTKTKSREVLIMPLHKSTANQNLTTDIGPGYY